jgi:hypothetical protein
MNKPAQSTRMEHPDDPAPAPARTPGTPVDRAFAAIVRSLTVDDPRFVRRMTRSGPGRVGVGDVMIVAGLLTTLLLGVLPLAVGLQTGLVVLLVLGVLGCTVLPVAAPLIVRRVVVRFRPLMR